MAQTLKSLTFKVSVERGLQRLRELIVYVSKKSELDPNFGAIKLNKILYHSDFIAFERFGVPLTGAPYFRIRNGPAPKAMVPIRDELLREKAIRIERVARGPYEQHRVVALREPVMQHFTADEIAIVDEVIAALWSQNATEVSDASHDVRWRVLTDKAEMPYEFAFLSDEPATADDIARFAELNAEHHWE